MGIGDLLHDRMRRAVCQLVVLLYNSNSNCNSSNSNSTDSNSNMREKGNFCLACVICFYVSVTAL